jgi:chemotaxis regulatin CheY-phosphate phosphatase CheZ
MNEKELNLLLQKADELRSLFVLGQRVIPFLEEIFVFIKDIQPMLDEINVSINDNLKKIPGASEKLSKVTEANEMATGEIMDSLDKVFDKTTQMSNNNKKLKEYYDNISRKPLNLLEILHKAIQQDSDLNEILPPLGSAINKLKNINVAEIDSLEKDNASIVDNINNDASAIMMSLQVQDISAQQIAAVDHMIRAVQGKLQHILTQFKETDLSELSTASKKINAEKDNITHFHRDIAFDPNAIDSITGDPDRQDDVDELLKQHASGEDISANEKSVGNEKGEVSEEIVDDTPANPDDIDAMFASGKVETSEKMEPEEEKANDEPASPDDIDAMFASGGVVETSEEEVVSEESVDDTPASPDDIDAMFADVSDDAPIDPDDIDAMFSK